MARLLYNQHLKGYARELRKSMTDAEVRLWSKIRMKQAGGFQFYRQKAIGNYIADFFCPKAKLVIEVDGGQHYTEKGSEADRQRDEYMKTCGIKVLRFTDTDVLKNIDGVCEMILRTLEALSENPPSSPFAKGGECHQ